MSKIPITRNERASHCYKVLLWHIIKATGVYFQPFSALAHGEGSRLLYGSTFLLTTTRSFTQNIQFRKKSRRKWELKDDVVQTPYSERSRLYLANQQFSLALFGCINTSSWMNLGLGLLVIQVGTRLQHTKTPIWVVFTFPI